jgi:hypothetical protein
MGRPRPLRAATMAEKPDLTNSPLYLIAVLHSARKSKDQALEQVTRRKLAKLGVRIIFDDERPSPDTTPPKEDRTDE